MCALSSFNYVQIRVVPRVEREEFINVGVILFCREKRFLQAGIRFDGTRLTDLYSDLDVAEVSRRLALIPWICAGDPAAGPIARLPQAGRFHWLTTPRSTMLQPSPIHSGLCDDPAPVLRRMLVALEHR